MAHKIEETSVSKAWYKMVDLIQHHSGNVISPLVVTLNNVDAHEEEKKNPVMNALNKLLIKQGFNDINTVANTIFPLTVYKLAKYDRERFFASYLRELPRIKALDTRNKDGIYFERLIQFDEVKKVNQLKFIIDEFTGRKGVRKSMLQAAIFDPNRDHKRNAQIAFPCLQHVSFTYDNGMLSVNGFYATQQLFDKAYGNLLGLVRLGNFMAREMNLKLDRVNCYIGAEKLERIGKTNPELVAIVDIAKQTFENE
jgi:thymidylate synthase